MRSEDTAEKTKEPTPRPFLPESQHAWKYENNENRHRPQHSTVGYSSEPPVRRFNFFTGFTLILCAIAVAFEAIGHPAAGIFQLDPIPNLGVLGLYILTVCILWMNHAVLGGSDDGRFGKWRNSPRALSLLIVGTIVSIMVALSASYMFLPLAGFGGILLLFAGLGLLLWTPFFALIALCIQLRGLIREWRGAGADSWEIRRTLGAATLAAASLFVWLIGIPIAAAHYTASALRSDSRADFEMLRRLNSEGILLDIAYNRKPNYWTCLGFNAYEMGWWPTSGLQTISADTDAARRAYFLVTGKPFEQVPRPMSYTNNSGNTWGNRGADDVALEETGGMLVGRKVPGLWLASSQMSGSADTTSGTGVVEWTLKFRNDTDQPQEARADILLPNNAVVHKVSLWINGVEQPARYGHPDRVRAAYQEVAVVQRRDPLLVTMPAPGHVLAQCFPVQPHSEMQIRLGFTGALVPDAGNRPTLELPALGMVNFDVPRSMRPHFQLADKQEEWDGRDLFDVHRIVVGDRRYGGQRDIKPLRLIIAIDASEGMRETLADPPLDTWLTALNYVPAGSTVDLLFTDAPEKMVRWSPGQPLPRAFLKRGVFGGTDPQKALLRALQKAGEKGEMPAAVLFVHAASPHGVTNLEPLRQELQRDYWNGPALVGIQVAREAPDTLVKDLSGFPRVFTLRAIPHASQIGEAFHEAMWLSQPRPAGGVKSNEYSASKTRNAIVLFDKVLAAWRYANTLPSADALEVRITAGREAADAQLVTPLSSAVVLETREQYQRHGLEERDEKGKQEKRTVDATDKPADLKKPGLPEPGTFALVGLGLLVVPLLRKRR